MIPDLSIERARVHVHIVVPSLAVLTSIFVHQRGGAHGRVAEEGQYECRVGVVAAAPSYVLVARRR